MNQNSNNNLNDKNSNYFYGVDVTDKEAVQKEFESLQKQHRKITVLVVIILLIFGLIFVEFARVNFLDGKPLLAIPEKVDGGILYNGIGYQVLYCDSGERYIDAVMYQKCDDIEQKNFNNVIYEKFVDYSESNKIIVKKDVKELKINSITFDENNSEGGSDYLLNISLACNGENDKCVQFKKEYSDFNNINLYISLNKYNEIYNIFYFKNTGAYYESLVSVLTANTKKYLIDNNKLQEDNLRNYSIKIVNNYGKYKFRGISYYDSYLIEINYSCSDNSNICVSSFDNKDLEGDYANLVFYAAVFVNNKNEILLMGPREYFDL